MKRKNNMKSDDKLTFTLRMDTKTQEIVKFLQDQTMLSKAGVVKLALMNLYKQQMATEPEIKQKR